MCKYCEWDTNDSDYADDYIDEKVFEFDFADPEVDLIIVKKDDEYFINNMIYLTKKLEFEWKTKIKYCPICGRELK